MKQMLSKTCKKSQPSDTLISDFWFPELWKNILGHPGCTLFEQLWETNIQTKELRTGVLDK